MTDVGDTRPTYIYTLSDPRTGEVRYVGKSVDPTKRLEKHISDAKQKLKNSYVQNWIRSLVNIGIIPVQEVIEKCGEDWVERETFWIAHYRALPNAQMTNVTDGGEGTCGHIHSEETRAKMSAAHKGKNNHNYGKKLSTETRAKISAAHKGKKFSDETLAKISSANKGKKRSDETRAKISAVQKGKKLSAKTRAKLSAAHKNPSAETRAKLSAAQKGHSVSAKTRAKISAARKAYWAKKRAEATA
jgi:group I intron endonuclease